MASARASRFWEGDVEGPIAQGGTGNMGGGIGRGDVKHCEAGLGKILGGTGNYPRVIIIGIFGGDKISIVMLLATSPAMVGGMTWGGDR